MKATADVTVAYENLWTSCKTVVINSEQMERNNKHATSENQRDMYKFWVVTSNIYQAFWFILSCLRF